MARWGGEWVFGKIGGRARRYIQWNVTEVDRFVKTVFRPFLSTSISGKRTVSESDSVFGPVPERSCFFSFRENLPRGLVVQGLVRAFGIVEDEPVPDSFSGLTGRIVLVEVHFFILDASPEPFREDVVRGSSFPVHANPTCAESTLRQRRINDLG